MGLSPAELMRATPLGSEESVRGFLRPDVIEQKSYVDSTGFDSGIWVEKVAKVVDSFFWREYLAKSESSAINFILMICKTTRMMVILYRLKFHQAVRIEKRSELTLNILQIDITK